MSGSENVEQYLLEYQLLNGEKMDDWRIAPLDEGTFKADFGGLNLEEIIFPTTLGASIVELNVSLNKLTELHSSINNMPNLRSLSVSSNMLQSLPYTGTELRILDLRYNEFHDFKEVLPFTQLEKLYITSNKYTDLSGIKNFENIREIRADNNFIGHLDEEIGSLKKLIILDLSENPISKIPSNIAYLDSLQELRLAKTQIQQLPKTIANLYELRVLDLSNTKIKELPITLGDMDSLRKLLLSNTQVSVFPEELGQLDLRELDVSHTKIRSFPLQMSQMKLKRLEIEGIRLKEGRGGKYQVGLLLERGTDVIGQIGAENFSKLNLRHKILFVLIVLGIPAIGILTGFLT